MSHPSSIIHQYEPFIFRFGRITHFYPPVKAQQEEAGIQPQSGSGSHRYLFVKITAQQSSFSVFIFIDVPYISHIQEESTLQQPEEFEPVFEVRFQFKVPHTVGVIVFRHIRPRSQCSCLPCPHAVGPTTIKSLFERQHFHVSVWIAAPQKYPVNHRIRPVDVMIEAIFAIQFQKLGVTYPQNFIIAFVVLPDSPASEQVVHRPQKLPEVSKLQRK